MAPRPTRSAAIKGAGLVALGRIIDVPNRRPSPHPAASSRWTISARAPTHRRPQEHL